MVGFLVAINSDLPPMGMDVKVQVEGTQVSSGKSANLRSRCSCENQNIQKFVFDLKKSTEPNRWNDDIFKNKKNIFETN